MKLAGKTGDYGKKHAEIIVPLKYLRNFWRTLKMPLVICEVNLDLNWSKNWFIVATAVEDQRSTFSIADTKLYAQVVTLSTQDSAKLVEQLRSGFQKTINWNKYQSKISTERKKSIFRLLNWSKFLRSK